MIERRPRSKLRVYQHWTVDLLTAMLQPATRMPGVILAYDMGTGKTGAVLTALLDWFNGFQIRRALVIAPLLVAKTTWPDEIDAWEHTRGLSWTLLRVEDDDPEVRAHWQLVYDDTKTLGENAKEARRRADAAAIQAKYAKLARLAETDTEIHIINRQAARWLVEHFGGRWPYDVIVIDEPPFKSGKKRTAKKVDDDGSESGGGLTTMGALVKVRRLSQLVILLTGTPTPKGLINLWPLAYFVDLGKRLGGSKSAFLKRWFTQDRYSYKIEPRDNAESEIIPLISDIMFSLDPDDLAELPPVINNPIKVKLSPEAMQAYHQFKRDMVFEEHDIEAANAGVLHNKLLQFANGSMYREDGNDVHIHDAKIDALADVVEQVNGAPLLVFYTFQFDLRRIRKKFPKAVVLNEGDPRDIVKRWNAGQIDMLLAHRASAGHGLNLQYGSNHMVEYGLTSDLELYLQARKRLQRPGSTAERIFNHIIMAEGTIDEDIFPLYIDPKTETQDRILAAVKVSMSTVT